MQATAAQALRVWELALLLNKEAFLLAYTEEQILESIPRTQTHEQAQSTIQRMRLEYENLVKTLGHDRPVSIKQIRFGRELEAKLGLPHREWHTQTTTQASAGIYALLQEKEHELRKKHTEPMNAVDQLIRQAF